MTAVSTNQTPHSQSEHHHPNYAPTNHGAEPGTTAFGTLAPDRAFDFTLGDRIQIHHLICAVQPTEAEGQDVIQGLTQTPKTLPPRYFYDEQGSQLFEQICDLPEYYLTRTETTIFKTCADAIAAKTGACEIVELGSGSSTKTRLLLDAYEQAQLPLIYCPIDVSASILELSAQALIQDYSTLHIQGLVGTYELALQQLPPNPLPQRMICFIGSTLGNLNPQDCDHFLDRVTQALVPGDFFLLGVDLQKPISILEAAYNDRQGVTAEFNLNMLRHLNRRFDGNFDLSQFRHRAIYNPNLHQIEMHLESLVDQTVTLRSLDLTIAFSAGETILSEISRKFNLTPLTQQLATKGLVALETWMDAQQWFGVMLCQYRSA
ncbi:L-histidine N(alpha)-methyltransferase [Alkalinema sp. FACHB-956]|uniref:L-histidine N(alpha)-methyltransferase n=1 Tax=Alkalinema sp. FACHB-956 TaxID=2692768 RepID=UPI0016897C71|nr:L-histidine N(alpha)-methyltransferase [Alkalinema sp. FACHB-956]MBD2330124.1 L-histidine N(alpha)-methyltransferase [Alkalinema sp. FACHB-956]